MHRDKEAELACTKGLASSPHSMTAAVQLSRLLRSTKQDAAALDVLEQAQQQLQQPTAAPMDSRLKQVSVRTAC